MSLRTVRETKKEVCNEHFSEEVYGRTVESKVEETLKSRKVLRHWQLTTLQFTVAEKQVGKAESRAVNILANKVHHTYFDRHPTATSNMSCIT